MTETRADTICVIDDDQAVRESMVALLEASGYTVKPFASADDFLRRQGSQSTDCLLLDLNMPGLNGLELLELLRSRGVTAPAIVLTANGERFGARLTRAGVLKVLHKPVSETDLLQWIETALASRKASPTGK
jgi:FixJ family two-component response regulator